MSSTQRSRNEKTPAVPPQAPTHRKTISIDHDSRGRSTSVATTTNASPRRRQDTTAGASLNPPSYENRKRDTSPAQKSRDNLSDTSRLLGEQLALSKENEAIRTRIQKIKGSKKEPSKAQVVEMETLTEKIKSNVERGKAINEEMAVIRDSSLKQK